MENLNEFLNCYNEKDHSIALNNRNIYVSYSGDYKGNPINHVHNSCELLFIEQGGGEYKIRDQQYHIEKNGVLIIGGTDPHSRRFTQVPCIRYGLTVLPAFLQSLPVINSYMNVYRTHSPEEANKLRGIDDVTFNRMVSIIWQLREETKDNGQGKGDMVYALLLEMTIILNRLLQLEKQDISITELSEVVGYASVNTFLRQFRESLGISPLQYKKQFEQYKEDAGKTRLTWDIREKKKY